MFRTCAVALAVVSMSFLAACGDDAPSEQHLDPATWCDSVAGGPSGTLGLAADLSAAHAGVRSFGAEMDGGTADVALADALNAPDALEQSGIAATLDAYKKPLLQVCVVPANDTAIGPVQIEMQGAVAVIHPGTGDVVIPSSAAAVAIDLRDVPNREDVEAGLEAAVAATLDAPNSRGQWLVQINAGLPPELSAFTSGYFGSQLGPLLPTPLPGTAAHALPLALITGPKMAYAAAELAADLRLSNKAWLVGSDVRVAVAESCWQGVGGLGIAYRCRELSSGTHRWPDAIPADYPLSKLDSMLGQLPSLGLPEPVSATLANDRPYMAIVNPTTRPEPTTTRLGDARAALITAHGAARLYYPYFATLGDGLDARLDETLNGLGASPDRAQVLTALRHFSEVLADGQAFAEDGQDTGTDRLPLVLDQIGGEPVVRASGDSNVHPGDRIAAIDGTAFDAWYAAQAPLISASTEAFRIERSLALLTQRSTAVLSLVDPAGATRDVTVAAKPVSAFEATRTGALRASGMLAGTNVYYLNADPSQLDTEDTLKAQLLAAKDADGLVVDLRGSSVVSPYDLVAAIVPHNLKTPLFRTPIWHGREAFELSEAQTTVSPSSFVFNKKLVLLVGPATLSSAETAVTAVWDGSQLDSPVRMKIVGRNTAGTAGIPSGIRLPGGFTFGFTSMEFLHADGTTVFEGVGIAPDVTAEPTAQDLADGTDTELTAALNTLSAMSP